MIRKPRLVRETRRIGPTDPMPMPPERPRPSDADLNAFLRARRAASPVNRLSGLDGYLAAIIVGPKFIDSRIWAAAIVGEQAMMMAEGTLESLAIQAIVQHYNRISMILSDASDLYRPQFDRDRLGKPDLLFWKLGFYQGYRPRQAAVRAGHGSKEARPAHF